MGIPVGAPVSGNGLGACPLVEGQCGVLGTAGIAGTQEKGEGCGSDGFLFVLLNQLSLWVGVLAARIPACLSVRSRGVSCGCCSVSTLCELSRRYGPVVSLVGCTSLMSSGSLCGSSLCAVEVLVLFSVHHLAP